MDKTLEDAINDESTMEPTYAGQEMHDFPCFSYGDVKAEKRRAVEMAIRRAAEVCWQAGTQMSPSKQAGSDEAAAAILKLLD
jgi:hypothetical protein